MQRPCVEQVGGKVGYIENRDDDGQFDHEVGHISSEIQESGHCQQECGPLELSGSASDMDQIDNIQALE